jgi:hypothetical protein
MNWELIIWLTGLMLFTYWFNYVMGSPAADDIAKVDVNGILFELPFSLAYRRLIMRRDRKAKLESIEEHYREEQSVTSDPLTEWGLYEDERREIFRVGREFFTWERSITCPICLHWWLTVIFGAVCISLNLLHAREDYLLAGFTYLLNHLFIRKIA